MKTPDNIPFEKSLIGKGSTRWKSFVTGAFTQIILTGMVAVLPVVLPNPLRPNFRERAVVDITMPTIRRNLPPSHKSESPENRKRANPKSHASLAGVRNPLPLPVISAPVPGMAKSVRRVAAPTVVFTGPVPELPLGISAIPMLQAPRAQTQMGDFADFNGAAPEGGPAGSGLLSAVDHAGGIRSKASPVVILFKPRPQYTFDALTSKVQGDVLLAVLFSASGSVKVLSIIHGLGYGLDESAEAATREIRFRPARNREGIPVDTTAIVRATFDLSYCGAGCLTASTNR